MEENLDGKINNQVWEKIITVIEKDGPSFSELQAQTVITISSIKYYVFSIKKHIYRRYILNYGIFDK